MAASLPIRVRDDATGRAVEVSFLRKSERVAAFAARVARALGRAPATYRLIHGGKDLHAQLPGATLHDISLDQGATVLVFPPRTNENADPEIDVLAEVDEKCDPDDPAAWILSAEDDEATGCKTCRAARKRGAPKEKCLRCGCIYCQAKACVNDKTIACNDCDGWAHWSCAGLTRAWPDNEWFCKPCQDDKGTTDPTIKQKGKAATTTRANWGGGNSCAGFLFKCSIVDQRHVGPIPGIRCGQSWQQRRICSSAGVHRPPVAGIAGTAELGAVSLVISGGYTDDEDEGDEFLYTGAGGRDARDDGKNGRNGKHNKDQTLTGVNLALAKTCDAPVNATTGAEARDWRNSRGVRVCRSDKAKRHNAAVAPPAGVRYDGIYKLVKYYPERSVKHGFIVWRYRFRRDDPEPAPWTPAGKQYMEQYNLRMITVDEYARGFVSSEGLDQEPEENNVDNASSSPLPSSTCSDAAPAAKRAAKAWAPSSKALVAIAADTRHAAVWRDLLEREFLPGALPLELERGLACPMCLHLPLHSPMTPPCGHSVCGECLARYVVHARTKVNKQDEPDPNANCPICRAPVVVDGEHKYQADNQLVAALQAMGLPAQV